jgi:hypothetical protein
MASRSPDAAPDRLRAPLDRADGPWLAALLLLGVLVLAGFALHAYRVTDGRGGVPLDDAWIHFQFARNLARGDGFAFNPGEPTAGSTAPLWTVLLAGAYALGGRFPLAGQLLSGASFLVALAATYALAKQVTGRRWPAWLAGAVAAVNGRLAWAGLSALETPLFAALSLLGISSHLRQRGRDRYRLRTAALFGLATLARPEGLLLFALSLTDAALFALQRDGSDRPSRHACTPRGVRGERRRSPRTLGGYGNPPYIGFRKSSRATRAVSWVSRLACRLLPALALFAALVLPYVAFSLRTAGHPVPNTFSAKTTFNARPDLAFLSLASQYLILDNPLLLPFFVLGVGVLFSRARVLSAWSVGLPLVYAFLHATLYQHGRYLIPLIPCNAVVAVVGLLEARRLALRRNWRWGGSKAGLVLLVTALVVAGTAWRLPTMARLYAQDVENINQMHVAIGRWVAEQTPSDALLALNDIGAITYVSERRIVDLAGLVTPEVVPLLHTRNPAPRLVALMAERGVDYVIIFPSWFPGLAEREDVLEPVHRVTLERRTITGGKTMVVYRAQWGP